MNWPDSILTERLLLRRPRPGDGAQAFAAYAGDAEVMRYLGWVRHTEAAQTEAMLAYQAQRWVKRAAFTYVLTTRTPDASVVGVLEITPSAPRASLGFALARRCWGQGLMSEVLRRIVPLALAQPGLHRVEAVCDVENPASRRVLERAGLVCEGRLACYLWHPNAGSEPRDVWMMACAGRDTAEPMAL